MTNFPFLAPLRRASLTAAFRPSLLTVLHRQLPHEKPVTRRISKECPRSFVRERLSWPCSSRLVPTTSSCPQVIFVPLATRFAVPFELVNHLCLHSGSLVAVFVFNYSNARVEPRAIASTLSRKEKSVTSRPSKDQLDRQQSLKSSRIGSGGPSSKVVPSEAS